MSAAESPSSAAGSEPSFWLWSATLVALAALAGSLYLSMGMGLKACPLCLYQRTFVMGVVAVLVVGLFVREIRPGVLSLLALPLAAGGLVIAGFHSYLEWIGVLECPAGILEIASAPQQSLAALGLLTLLLIIDQLAQGRVAGVVGAIVLGGLLAFSAVRSAPPSPEPTEPYRVPVHQDGCRKPYQPPET